jgi:hypothetical protein
MVKNDLRSIGAKIRLIAYGKTTPLYDLCFLKSAWPFSGSNKCPDVDDIMRLEISV